MKKIITTVGTSIITNYLEKNEDDISGQFEIIKEKFASDWDSQRTNIEIIRKKVSAWAESNGKLKASAEIQSILKIKEEINEDVEVYLIATDTITSRLAAELIQNWIKDYDKDLPVHFNSTHDVIKGLQVKSQENFQKVGLVTLLNRLNQLADGYWESFVFNITGGYKALIPYMTIISQIHSAPSYYTFQDESDKDFELLRIPQLPIDLKEDCFEVFGQEFQKLETLEIGEKDDFHYEFLTTCSSCLEIDGKEIVLNPLGKLLWEKYKSKYFLFYSPDDVWRDIKNQKEINRIIQSKFHIKQERDNKIKPEKQHKTVFKDGDNSNRIYYFENSGSVYIYKTFENHQAHEKFLETSFNDAIKDSLVKFSNLRKVKIHE